MNLIQQLEQEEIARLNKEIPEFAPGDTVIIRADLTEPIRRSIVTMYCQAFVGEKLVAEGEMTAQVIKNK